MKTNKKVVKKKIQMFFHCRNCLDMKTLVDVSHLEVGWTKKGLQVWCKTCDSNIVALDFLGQKVDYEK